MRWEREQGGSKGEGSSSLPSFAPVRFFNHGYHDRALRLSLGNFLRHELSVATIKKNAAAVALGRLGGLKGGKARARKLTAEQRRESARKAADGFLFNFRPRGII